MMQQSILKSYKWDFFCIIYWLVEINTQTVVATQCEEFSFLNKRHMFQVTSMPPQVSAS